MWVGFGFPKGVSISLCSNQLQKAPLKSGDLQLLLSLQNSICNDLRINMESLEEHFHQKKKRELPNLPGEWKKFGHHADLMLTGPCSARIMLRNAATCSCGSEKKAETFSTGGL